jgi:hypothetical protein
LARSDLRNHRLPYLLLLVNEADQLGTRRAIHVGPEIAVPLRKNLGTSELAVRPHIGWFELGCASRHFRTSKIRHETHETFILVILMMAVE